MREYGLAHEDPAEKKRAMQLPSVPFDLNLDDPELQRRVREKQSREWMVAALNGPGGLPELLVAMVSPGHEGWVPKGMFFWTWRDISWPLLGLFFWWLAGRAVDALFAARRKIARPKLGWWEVVPAMLVFAYGGMLMICMIGMQEARGTPHREAFVAIGCMWMVFGASIVRAKFLQRRMARLVQEQVTANQ